MLRSTEQTTHALLVRALLSRALLVRPIQFTARTVSTHP